MNVWSSRENNIERNGLVIGIDFGTSNSCVAIWHRGKNRAKIVRNIDKQRITPSTIQFTHDFKHWRVGVSPDGAHSVVAEIKLLVNQMSSEGSISTVKCWNSEGSSKDFQIDQLLSYMLSYLRKTAQDYMKLKRIEFEIIDAVVLGVPANFSSNSRKILKRAASLANFKEVHFMIESTAAAMAYGLLVAGSKKIAVIDVGGGTTDVTLMDVEEGGVCRVLQTGGHAVCGGVAMDALLTSHVLYRLMQGGQLTEAQCAELKCSSDHALNPRQRAMQTACRVAKEALTEASSSVVHLSAAVTLDRALDCEITREEFDRVIQPVTDKLYATVVSVVQAQAASQSQAQPPHLALCVDECVVVGGGSLVPAVRLAIRRALAHCGVTSFAEQGTGVLCTAVNPHEAVALGLAIRAAVLMGQSQGKLKDLLMLDVLPSAIGVVTWSGPNPNANTSRSSSSSSSCGAGERFFDPVVNKGDKIPCKGRRQFSVLDRQQRRVTVALYEEIEEATAVRHLPSDMPDDDTTDGAEDVSQGQAQRQRQGQEQVQVQLSVRYEQLGSYDLLVPQAVQDKWHKDPDKAPTVDLVLEMSQEGEITFSLADDDLDEQGEPEHPLDKQLRLNRLAIGEWVNWNTLPLWGYLIFIFLLFIHTKFNNSIPN